MGHSQIIDNAGNFSVNALKKFKQLHLYSNSIPREFGGDELDATGVTRLIEETGKYPSLGMGLIYNNEIAAKAILLHGTSDQKSKYLSKLASGQLKAAFCYSELGNGVDECNFKTVSTLNKSDDTKVMNLVLFFQF